MLCERNFLPVGMTELFFEKVLYFFVCNHLLIKNISTGLRALHHFDYLSVGTSIHFTGMEGCHCLFCHSILILFYFFMNCHSPQNRIVFLQFQSFRSILSILGSDVPGHSWHAGFFLFSTFKNHLHSVSFAFLCHRQ